jgi:HemY protein
MQDNSPLAPALDRAGASAAPPPPAEAVPAAAPLFRARSDLPKAADKPAIPAIPPVIPIVRAPDDPGVDDDERVTDDFAERIAPASGQASGWRGFLSRWGG